MDRRLHDSSFLGTAGIGHVLLKVAPPVMIAQLIQALYNIVDSFFVGKFSGDGLTALSVIFPIQLVIAALAVGTGVGVNTYMARELARGDEYSAKKTAGTGLLLAVVTWAVFAVISRLVMGPFVGVSANTNEAKSFAVTYGTIVCVGSLGTFLESMWSKVHQATGNMLLPMIAQVSGALTNIALDYILIFGKFGLPALGIAGAAYATVAGQFVSAAIVGVTGFHLPPKPKQIWGQIREIYHFGYPNIIMQTLYTVYIVVLNIILKGFSDEAVTVLGLYYKLQAFFFIPLLGLMTCIGPVLSYNYERGDYIRCKKLMTDSFLVSAGFMVLGIFCFEALPRQLIGLFSEDPEVFLIGVPAFRIIGLSFVSAVFSLMMPVFFQAIGRAVPSVMLSLTRQIFCLMPIFWLLSLIGLQYVWIAFPVSETIAGGVGLIMYFIQLKKWGSQAKQT